MTNSIRSSRTDEAELAEIEQLVAGHPLIARATAMFVEEPGDEELLIVYATAVKSAGGVRPEEIQAALIVELPDYAVPDLLVLLEAMPLTSAGEVAAELLPPPTVTMLEQTSSVRAELVGDFVSAVFNLAAIDARENFFDLGMNSLLMSRLITLLRSAVPDVDVRVRDLTVAETIGSFIADFDCRGARPAPIGADRPASRQPDTAGLEQRDWPVGPAIVASPRAVAFEVEGSLDRDVLKDALADVVRRHDGLRTLHRRGAGSLREIIVDPAGVTVELPVMQVHQPGMLGPAVVSAISRPLDRCCDLPLRATLFEVGPDQHVLLLVASAEACDGQSVRLIWRDVVHAYTSRSAGYQPVWEVQPIRYPEYLDWKWDLSAQRDGASGATLDQLGYWRQALRNVPDELLLPRDRPRTARLTRQSGTATFTINEDQVRGLRGVARKHHSTLRMVLQAGLAACLTRLGAGSDIPLGVTSKGRLDPRLAQMVGPLGNDLVLRVDTSGDPDFGALVTRVRQAALDADAHREVPFALVAEEIDSKKFRDRHQLFQVSVDLERSAGREIGLPGFSTSEYFIEDGFDLDLSITFVERNTRDGGPTILSGELRYSKDQFDESTAESISDMLLHLLTVVAKEPERPLSKLPTQPGRQGTGQPTTVEKGS